MKTGLIMEGGAMRGMFTCGVIDVFMENEITFDGAAGVSAGAVFGCNFKSGQIGRPIRYNKNYCRDWRYCSIRSLIRTGNLFGADFCYHELPDVLDPFDSDTFQTNPMEFYIVATDIRTGEPVYHLCSDGRDRDIEWMRASASMPLASRIVETEGMKLLDGGIADPVPYRFMEKLGYGRNVMILTQPKGYYKKRAEIIPAIRAVYQRYPKLIEAMEQRHVVYNRQMAEIREREQSGAALVIRPPEALGIGHVSHDPEDLERVYRIGRREAERRLPEIRTCLRKG
ncbi:MAG: patatin family protein [Oscillospiraceae bacterium]|nr:patatin family protein [Oscillospiraceae bacterium]